MEVQLSRKKVYGWAEKFFQGHSNVDEDRAGRPIGITTKATVGRVEQNFFSREKSNNEQHSNCCRDYSTSHAVAYAIMRDRLNFSTDEAERKVRTWMRHQQIQFYAAGIGALIKAGFIMLTKAGKAQNM